MNSLLSIIDEFKDKLIIFSDKIFTFVDEIFCKEKPLLMKFYFIIENFQR